MRQQGDQRMRFTSTFLLPVVVAVIVTAALFAQQATGGISGTVIDPNGNPVTNFNDVDVQATNTATSAVFKARLDEKTGTFALTGLPAGTYDLVVPVGGALYQNFTQKGVVVMAGETLRMMPSVSWGMNLGTIADAPDVLARDMARKALSMPTTPTPRTLDGHPDFTGVYVNYGNVGRFGGAGARPMPPKLQPAYAEKLKQLQAAGPVLQGSRICLPGAQPDFGHVFKFVQAPSEVIHIGEESTPGFRQIFLDGRPHPKIWNPAWQGHSIGKWEGETLVVDTTGFNEQVAYGPIHSEKLHIVERISRPDMAHLEIETTADDPEAWMPGETMKSAIHGVLALDQEVLEFVCQEGNRLPIPAAPAVLATPGSGR